MRVCRTLFLQEQPVQTVKVRLAQYLARVAGHGRCAATTHPPEWPGCGTTRASPEEFGVVIADIVVEMRAGEQRSGLYPRGAHPSAKAEYAAHAQAHDQVPTTPQGANAYWTQYQRCAVAPCPTHDAAENGWWQPCPLSLSNTHAAHRPSTTGVLFEQRAATVLSALWL